MLRRLFQMLKYTRPYFGVYLAGTLSLLVVDALDTFAPQIIRWTIDHLMYRTAAPGEAVYDSPLPRVFPSSWFGAESFMGGMWVYGALYVLTVALTGMFRYFMSMGYAKGAIRLTHDLRGRFFGHVQRLQASFHDRTKSGDLMTLATSDINACREFYWVGIMIGLDTFFYFVMVPLYMVSISWKLLLASLCTLPLIPFIVARLAARIEKRYDALQDQLSLVAERTRESFAGAKVVKSFAKEDNEIRTFATMAGEYKKRALRLSAIEALQQPLLVLMLALADLVVVIYGGSLVLEGIRIQRDMAAAGASQAQIQQAISDAGAVSVGGFVAFFSYLIRMSGPMIGMGWVISLFQRARVSMDRIEEVLHTQPAIADSPTPAPVTHLKGAIEFRNLDFAYFPEGEPEPEPEKGKTGKVASRPKALQGISFKVEAGRTVAIVGPVGSGKSTLLSLVPRLYDPPAGTVFLDGVDVREMPLEVLRTQIGAVPQETFLFSETILQNVALGAQGSAEQAPDAEWLKECARMAQVEGDILAFPKPYETLLGEKGVNLSGGQKQRVAIARALARKPAILLLDDCLSAVDTQTEEAILKHLKQIMKDRTTLIVSHRVSTVEEADEILVLNEGRVVERGRHGELLALGGYYADLHRKQQLEDELAKRD
ncbi:MAG: ABC transporter ATP-binding protein [Planctomycetes bacterium]|nr:ABC transporter ATP-binding protein [Planctomycetota bacterium]